MKPSRLLLVVGTPLLCANHVPASTDQQLTEASDLVIIGHVATVDLTPPSATSVQVEPGVVFVHARSPCVSVVVERNLKGMATGPVIVCAHPISELTPNPQQIGKRYAMYLRRLGTVYVATSWDGIQELPPT